MKGVVMSVKGRYAVLLTKNGEFVKIKNKKYSIGDKVTASSNVGRICAVAASFLVVCGGIGSYFTPVGYVSVDINPSLMMTVNLYKRIIDVKPLNSDAEVLLENTSVAGKTMEDSVDELIKKSEEIGYLNENNNDVIVDIVSNVVKVKIPNKDYDNVKVVVETADKETLKNAKEMGISIAKAKALDEYTKKNGGSIEVNAKKLNDKSVKEIRKDMEIKEVSSVPKSISQPKQKNKDVINTTDDMVLKSENKTATKKTSNNESIKDDSYVWQETYTNTISVISQVTQKTDEVVKKVSEPIFDNAIIEILPNPVQEIIIKQNDDIKIPVISKEKDKEDKNNGFIGVDLHTEPNVPKVDEEKNNNDNKGSANRNKNEQIQPSNDDRIYDEEKPNYDSQEGKKQENNVPKPDNQKENTKPIEPDDKPIDNGNKPEENDKPIDNGNKPEKNDKPIDNGNKPEENDRPIDNGSKQEENYKSIENKGPNHNQEPQKDNSGNSNRENDTKTPPSNGGANEGHSGETGGGSTPRENGMRE